METSARRRGCWTCKVRHKKCDGLYPQCKACSSLLLTCYNGEEKPPWMDNGPLQQAMTVKLKEEVKASGNMRLNLGYMRQVEGLAPQPPAPTRNKQSRPGPGTHPETTVAGLTSELADSTLQQRETAHRPGVSDQSTRNPTVTAVLSNPQRGQPAKRVWPGCDPGFISYYLDFFFPFLFPFYQPSMLEGGRTWLLEFIDEAEGMHQITLALSSYMFSIVLDATEAGHAICKKIGWDKLLSEMKNTFTSLKQDIQHLVSQGGTNTVEHLPRAVRVLGVIVHLQRFEIATRGFAHCEMHLGAAIQCFNQILAMASADLPRASADAKFFEAMAQLGPSPWPKPYQKFQIPSPDQVAFRFFLSVLVADDILSSTSLAQVPRLYEYHQELLCGPIETEVPVDSLSAIGCQNWVMMCISEISALAAWKQKNMTNPHLSAELAVRGIAIKSSLQNGIDSLPMAPRYDSTRIEPSDNVMNLFHVWQRQPHTPKYHSDVMTRIWAHAAMIYLLVTLHGNDPENVEVEQQVANVIGIFKGSLLETPMLRVVAWPFCVAGCLATPEKRDYFRDQSHLLQPPELFVTIFKAVEVMEAVWSRRDSAESADFTDASLADCFRATGEVIYLI